MGTPEVEAFLTHLAVERRMSASFQNQALSALFFLYKHLLDKDLGDLTDIVRAKGPKRLPVVLTQREVGAILCQLRGDYLLAAQLMYGSGLRVAECASLRVKDVDLARAEVTVRRGKGQVDRITTLPTRITEGLEDHIADVRRKHDHDRENSRYGGVTLPFALERKMPNAAFEVGWLFLFPATRRCTDRDGRLRRHHRDQTAIQRAIKAGVRRSDVRKKASCHTFRHSFATHLLDHGTDIRTVQKLMGHRSVTTTMIYLHLIGRGAYGARSPLDLGVDFGPRAPTET